MSVRVGFDPDNFQKREETEQRKKMYQADDPCQIDKWYPKVKDFTFLTKIIPLELDEANALKFMSEYYKLFKEHQIKTKEKKGKGINLFYDDEKLQTAVIQNLNNNSNLSYKWGESFDWKALGESSKQYVDPLKKLEKKIDEIIKEMNCKDGIFVRLSTRSPKDSALESTKMFDLLYDELKQWNNLNKKDTSDNKYLDVTNQQVINSFYRASIKSLCAVSGEESVELFCRSYRTFVDLNMSMLKQGEKNLKMFVIIRKWEKQIYPLWEFRLFIRNKIPTGLTQYHKSIVLPHMYKCKSNIQKMVLENFEKIQSNLPELTDYTMDFAIILEDEKKQNVNYLDEKSEEDEKYDDSISKSWMIEVNHEPPIAGTGLFLWEDENDKKILNDGPFETRIHDSYSKVDSTNLEGVLPDTTVAFVKLLRGESLKKPSQNKIIDTDSKCKCCIL